MIQVLSKPAKSSSSSSSDLTKIILVSGRDSFADAEVVDMPNAGKDTACDDPPDYPVAVEGPAISVVGGCGFPKKNVLGDAPYRTKDGF